jgi:hypothetical protein
VTVGPDGAIYTGTLFGASKYTPEEAIPLPSIVQVRAGVGQGRDLTRRARAALYDDADQTRDFMRRGVLQLEATQEALEKAFNAGEIPEKKNRLVSRYIWAAQVFLSGATRSFGGEIHWWDRLTVTIVLRLADSALKRAQHVLKVK